MLTLKLPKWLNRQAKPFSLDEPINIEKAPLYEIDLSTIKLTFANPPSPIKSRFANPTDARPFINIKSQSDYRFNPDTKAGSYDIYDVIWPFFANQKDTTAQFSLHLQVFLLTPGNEDCERFSNLQDVHSAARWLQEYYRYIQYSANDMQIAKTDTGELIIETGELDSLDNCLVADDSPIPTTLIPCAGQDAILIRPREDKLNYCIPITHRDLLVFSFRPTNHYNNIDKIDPFVPDGDFYQQFQSTEDFVNAIIQSIDIAKPNQNKSLTRHQGNSIT